MAQMLLTGMQQRRQKLWHLHETRSACQTLLSSHGMYQSGTKGRCLSPARGKTQNMFSRWLWKQGQEGRCLLEAWGGIPCDHEGCDKHAQTGGLCKRYFREQKEELHSQVSSLTAHAASSRIDILRLRSKMGADSMKYDAMEYELWLLERQQIANAAAAGEN
mmetsp:Transcript_11473/g.21244  ORF Transcript_11473/g.21244 Transcript_11473/m.21244 type:complete len:162 (-) Transcript_11473:492-977(-)